MCTAEEKGPEPKKKRSLSFLARLKKSRRSQDTVLENDAATVTAQWYSFAAFLFSCDIPSESSNHIDSFSSSFLEAYLTFIVTGTVRRVADRSLWLALVLWQERRNCVHFTVGVPRSTPVSLRRIPWDYYLDLHQYRLLFFFIIFSPRSWHWLL